MNNYLSQNEINLNNNNSLNIEELYENGYVFTRKDKGIMNQIVSLRIDLNDFIFNSENRRIKRKTENINIEVVDLPLDQVDYDFNIHKVGKEFYKAKNEDETVFTASKIKELVVDGQKSNFNKLAYFRDATQNNIVGYCILFESDNFVHYAFPFYDVEYPNKNIGMGMILKAIEYTIKKQKKYFYLGSVHTSKSLYKLQFNNLFWWDKNHWNDDLAALKNSITAS